MSHHNMSQDDHHDTLQPGSAAAEDKTSTASLEQKESELTDGAAQFKTSHNVSRRTSFNSLAPGQSKTEFEEELNAEDVKKAITFSPSITEAVGDIVPPIKEMQIPQVHIDKEQSILHKAMQRLKEDFCESRAQGELVKMYDLYTSSLVDNHVLEGHCHQLQEKVKQYEARHVWDPRVLKVLLIAERYRQEKALVDDEKNELEAEVLDMNLEMKHLDDIIKNKSKDNCKLQDDLKKAKEAEKQLELLETQLMRKDNELQALQESYETLLQTHAVAKAEAIPSIRRSSHYIQEESNRSISEREMIQRIGLIQGEKVTLKAEVEEKTKVLEATLRKMSALRLTADDLDKLRKENTKVIAKMQSEINRLMNSGSALEKKLLLVRDQLTLAKSEIVALKITLENCSQGNANLSHKISSKQKENAAMQRQVGGMHEKLALLKKERKRCEDSVGILRMESQIKDRDILLHQRKVSDKKMECDNLATKLFKLESYRVKHIELMRLTNLNSAQMIKEIASLRRSVAIEKTATSKAEAVMFRMQGNIELLQKEYLIMLDKNLLLVRNQEMASSTLEQYAANKANQDRRITNLIKTNIDLYTQTTSQQEIALIQTHQFQLKENEIKGLLSRLEEEHLKMERMVCKDKEKRAIIEQLYVEQTARDEKIKTLKGIIESFTMLNKSLSDKVEELSAQLRACLTQRELIRRQRDLFGMKLLQSKGETTLTKESLRNAKDTLIKYSVDFHNKMNDLRILKLEIKNLRRKNKLNESNQELILTLRQELGQACKALELQKCKNVILEETKMPNTHRWRGMLASDPSKYEMVVKNQLLIKRLISKSKEVARLEESLKQKDTMYMSLRVIVQRRMDTTLDPEVNNAKAVIRKQHRQIKALTAELNVSSDNLKQAKEKEEEYRRNLSIVMRESAELKAFKNKAYDAEKTEFPSLKSHPPLPMIMNSKRS